MDYWSLAKKAKGKRTDQNVVSSRLKQKKAEVSLVATTLSGEILSQESSSIRKVMFSA